MAGLGTITKAYRMNIKKPVYALLSTDNGVGCTYGDVKSFGEERQIQITPKVASGDLYGDGTLMSSDMKITGYDITTEINKMQQDVRADIFGHKFTANGEMVISDNDIANKFAFGYEVEQSNGQREVVWLLKCSAQPFSHTVAQAEGNIKYSSDSIKITTLKREFDGFFQVIGDTCNATFTNAKADAFFDTVPTAITVEQL